MKLSKEVISSRNNEIIKWAASLLDKKGREKSESFIAEGEKLTEEALRSFLPVTHIFVSEKKLEYFKEKFLKYFEEKKFTDTRIIVVSDSVFEKISTEKAPQGITCVIKYLDFFYNISIIYKEGFFLDDDERALMLCSVRDPSNLGAVIRSAAAFGVEHLILSSDCADVYNPKTLRSAMGSIFKLKVSRVSDVCSFIEAAKDHRRIFAAELRDGAVSLSDLKLNRSDILIIGNEGHGIPAEVSVLTSGSVYIPISEKTESLNASVAAAIFMWEQNKL